MKPHPEKPYGLNVSWVEEPETRRGRADGILILKEDWQFLITLDYQRYEFTVPRGFALDGPSVPWFGRALVPRNDQTEAPADVHDVLYAFRGEFTVKGSGQRLILSRYDCDSLFLIGVLKMHLARWRSVLASSVLWISGWVAWQCVSKTDIANRQLKVSVRALENKEACDDCGMETSKDCQFAACTHSR